MKKVFIICPVRDMTKKENKILNNYVKKLENSKHIVHFPPRDTDQVDPEHGYNICSQNYQSIVNADEIHVYFKKSSQGTFFDLGITFSEHKKNKKPIKIINKKDVLNIIKNSNKEKGFEFVLLKIENN